MTISASRPRQRELKCLLCTFRTKGGYPALYHHMIKNHPRERTVPADRNRLNPTRCPHCKMEFTNFTAMALHVSRTHPGQGNATTKGKTPRLQCLRCSYRTANIEHLAGHMKRAHPPGPKRHVCPTCKKLFDNWMAAAIHIRTHKEN